MTKKISKYIIAQRNDILDCKKMMSNEVFESEFCDTKPMKTKFRLTKHQKDFLPALLWLVSSGPRRSGRTTLLAYALLTVGNERKGTWLNVFDHTVWMIDSYQIRRILMDEIVKIANEIEMKIEIDHTKLKFRVI